MNISVDNLSAMRSNLEMQYNDLESEINILYSEKKDDVALEKVKVQDLIDKQLVLLDDIIFNLENIPKKYDEFIKLNKKYKQVVGD